jgi:hypothetical protein
VKKLQATITLEYDDKETAVAVAKAVSPDNLKTPPGLTVISELKNKSVVTEIKIEDKLATFIATIDDLLSCASTAEKTVKVLKNK